MDNDKLFDEIVYVGNELLWCVIGIENFLDIVLGISMGESDFLFGILIEELFGEERVLIR